MSSDCFVTCPRTVPFRAATVKGVSMGLRPPKWMKMDSGVGQAGSPALSLRAVEKRGEFDELDNMRGLGHLLVSPRVAQGISQRELARRFA